MSLHLHVRSLSAGNAVLVQDLTLQVHCGTIHTLMGPSGSGKSSLLAAICGTLTTGLAFDGDITLNDERLNDLPTEQRRVGILFQEDLLFAHMTVRENLLFAVPPTPKSQRATRDDKVRQGLQDLEMTAFANADPATLSGGQRARVALMRALLAEPRALLLDEPFSKLDADLRTRLRSFVFERVRQRQLPVLLVTHDESDIADPAFVTRLSHLVAPDDRHPPIPRVN